MLYSRSVSLCRPTGGAPAWGLPENCRVPVSAALGWPNKLSDNAWRLRKWQIHAAPSIDRAQLVSGNSSERFLDVHAILKEFNPLKESHLLVWGDSDDEDGAVQAEVPSSHAWEDDSSGYAGLEYQPSWIDYRDDSESEDSDSARLQGARGAARALAALLPGSEDEDTDGLQSKSGALPSTSIPNAYSAESGFLEILPHELEERLATGQFALLLDVRTRAEYDSGHIAGAFNLPLDTDLSAAVRGGSLDEYRDRAVAVVCGSGVRSGQATVRLTKVFGFGNVTNVAGGMQGWAREGLPVQVPQQRMGGGGGGGGCGCGGQGGGGGGCRGKTGA